MDDFCGSLFGSTTSDCYLMQNLCFIGSVSVMKFVKVLKHSKYFFYLFFIVDTNLNRLIFSRYTVN